MVARARIYLVDDMTIWYTCLFRKFPLDKMVWSYYLPNDQNANHYYHQEKHNSNQLIVFNSLKVNDIFWNAALNKINLFDQASCWSLTEYEMSRDMRFPTMWYLRPAKPKISLRICAVWSEALLVAWIFYECWAIDWTSFGVSKIKRRLHRLFWVYTCQIAILLEITCHGSYIQFLYTHIRLFGSYDTPPQQMKSQNDYLKAIYTLL